MAAKDALLHPELAHLFQDVCGGNFVGPENDGVDTRVVDDTQLVAVVGVAGHELLLDDDGMT